MPTVHFGKRPGRTRGRPENKATADGIAKIEVFSSGTTVVPEKQTVTTDGTGGTFTLALGAQESGNIAFDATIGTVETAIEALSNVTSATVTGEAGAWVIQFNDGAGPLDLLVADDTNLTGETEGTVVVLTQAGVANVNEYVSLVTEGDTGVYTLTFSAEESGDIDAGDGASEIETILETMTAITAVAVTGTGTLHDPFIIEFQTPAGDVGAVTSDVSGWSSTVVKAARAPGTDRV